MFDLASNAHLKYEPSVLANARTMELFDRRSEGLGAAFTKKLEPISKISMEASLHENFAKP